MSIKYGFWKWFSGRYERKRYRPSSKTFESLLFIWILNKDLCVFHFVFCSTWSISYLRIFNLYFTICLFICLVEYWHKLMGYIAVFFVWKFWMNFNVNFSYICLLVRINLKAFGLNTFRNWHDIPYSNKMILIPNKIFWIH